MIFYFSGTGNSQAIATEVSKSQNEKMIAISQATQLKTFNYSLQENEKVIFIFPIYAWAPPQLVLDFINELSFNGKTPSYISVIVTCGDNIGETEQLVENLLSEKGWKLDSFFTLIMPNNYLIIGNVDSKEEILKKLQRVNSQLTKINDCLLRQRQERVVIKGHLPKWVTIMGRKFFNSYATTTKPFYANDHCISCQICVKICPLNCVTFDEKPKWTGECMQCLACLHYCPKSAIQYGKRMENKARYTHPNVSWYQLNQSDNEE